MKRFLLVCGLFLAIISPSSADQIVLATDNRLKEPFGTAFDSKGAMYVIEMAEGNRLLKIDDAGKATHVAGKTEGGYSGDGGAPLDAQFSGPHNLAILPTDQVLIGDTWNGVVRQIDLGAKKVSTLAGFRVPVEQGKAAGPYCITLDFSGTRLYVANLTQIHMVDLANGSTKVVAGNGKKGKPDDGALATEAPLVDPRAVAPDRQGNLYILERSGHALRVVDSAGKIRTLVNASGKAGANGDGGLGIDATMNGPKHLCIDKDDSVIIADAENNLIRRYLPKTGKLERVAGTGKYGSAGVGGDPKECQLARPHGVTVHPKTGELYITDSYNNRVLRIAM
jgi:DNA-binding beta-propeller fold protein YncE